MTKIKDLPENERPREKLLDKGSKFLSDEELLAVILGKGTKKCDVLALAKKIVAIIDDRGLDLKIDDLLEIEGIGKAKTALIAAAFEFVRRRIKPEGLKIEKPEDVLPLVRHYADRRQEHFIVVSLNGANEVINVRVITKGLLNRTQVHPREVFAEAIADRAAAVILAHNHTSTNLTPSEDDIEVTRRLIEAGKILGIKVLDHLVFNEKGFKSIEV
ncbi:MAG: DNA repair protein RadC [Candidatus Cloacimonetes bacterium]|nr:DNA repair protein RadC [Candidatus Cloacimonadota bacterium]